MWDERYAVEEYVYGTEPNSFLAEYAGELSGPVLSIAEGEGRNAVFLAAQGLTVVGVDSSTVGLKKAQALARDRDVSITTQVADLNDYIPEADFYGAVVSIFAHLPAQTFPTAQLTWAWTDHAPQCLPWPWCRRPPRSRTRWPAAAASIHCLASPDAKQAMFAPHGFHPDTPDRNHQER